MSTLSQFTSGVKSIQRGVITITSGGFTATAGVSSVNTSKSLLSHLGNSWQNIQSGTYGTFNEGAAHGYIALSNSTTVTASRSISLHSLAVSWELVEYY